MWIYKLHFSSFYERDKINGRVEKASRWIESADFASFASNYNRSTHKLRELNKSLLTMDAYWNFSLEQQKQEK